MAVMRKDVLWGPLNRQLGGYLKWSLPVRKSNMCSLQNVRKMGLYRGMGVKSYVRVPAPQGSAAAGRLLQFLPTLHTHVTSICSDCVVEFDYFTNLVS